MTKIINAIRKDLLKNIDLRYKKVLQGFFKEKIKSYGVRSSNTKQIAKKYFNEIKNLDKNKIFSFCEKLLKSGYGEEKSIAFDWAFRLKNQYQKQDFKIFENWLKRYVSDWGDCDNFCTGVLGEFLLQFPEFFKKVKSWTKSESRWLKRASAVILIYSIRKNKFLKESFQISNILLTDKDDLVQKGYGWMLKELSNLYPKLVFDYVMQNKSRMPRIALRYAVEKLPEKFKKEAMR
jgi:3-methyladenine DNA glycosylase AlkD